MRCAGIRRHLQLSAQLSFGTSSAATHMIWCIQRKGLEDEILSLREDGSGSLTRGGAVLTGRWQEDKSGLRFSVQQGPSAGEYYMGRLDGPERTTLSKGVVGRGLKIVGKFSGMAALPPPPVPGLTAVPKVMPPPLASLPSSVQYVPEFISAEDEAVLLEHVRLAPAERWTGGSGRRNLNYGGKPSERQMVEPLPGWLQCLVDALVVSGGWPAATSPNHVLINEYTAGSGLTPHTDGPLYSARVATLSLGSDVLLDLHRPPNTADEPPARFAQLLLRRRSLNVMADDAYSAVWHGITAAPTDTVTELVANLECAAEELGEIITRAPRVSIVFVHKLQHEMHALGGAVTRENGPAFVAAPPATAAATAGGGEGVYE